MVLVFLMSRKFGLKGLRQAAPALWSFKQSIVMCSRRGIVLLIQTFQMPRDCPWQVVGMTSRPCLSHAWKFFSGYMINVR